jgi:hypothetical protein
MHAQNPCSARLLSGIPPVNRKSISEYSTGQTDFKGYLWEKKSPPTLLLAKEGGEPKEKERIRDQSAGLQPAIVRGAQSRVTAGAGTISFLQKGQNAVATFLSSMMDSALKDISNRVDPG